MQSAADWNRQIEPVVAPVQLGLRFRILCILTRQLKRELIGLAFFEHRSGGEHDWQAWETLAWRRRICRACGVGGSGDDKPGAEPKPAGHGAAIHAGRSAQGAARLRDL